MTAKEQIKWQKTGKHEWRVTVGEKHLCVRRDVSVRSWSVEPMFGHTPGTRKPRRQLRTALVRASVRIGNVVHWLKRGDHPYTVLRAKADAERYAESGEGETTITILED